MFALAKRRNTKKSANKFYYEVSIKFSIKTKLRCHPERSAAESKDLAQRTNYEVRFEWYQYGQNNNSH